jgi:hypothetical protein
MVLIKYMNGNDPLYEISPTFRNRSVEDDIYFNDNDNEEADLEEVNLDFNDAFIERQVKADNTSEEFKKEKEFIKIQNELEKRKKSLASKRKEIATLVADKISDYKQQQINALERIQKYVYAITNDYDRELETKIEELKIK